MMPVPAIRAWIDEPVTGAAIDRDATRVSGWVLDETGLLESALLVIDGGPGTYVRLGVARPDVGDAYPTVEHASSSGFEGTVDLRTVDRPVAHIALLIRLSDGTWHEAVAVDVQIVAPAREYGGARARAAFTIVHNEALMLPRWLDYYGRYFDANDLYVLDHDSTDGSTADLDGRCHVVPVHQEAAYEKLWHRSVVERFQALLLLSYDAVLFADADEFVVADPHRYTGLDAYIAELTRPAARCVGFNVVHQLDEPPLRFDAPLLGQRRYWHSSLTYSKRLLSRIPLQWSYGFHQEYNAPDDPPDPELLLIHLHRVDHDTTLARHKEAIARDWNKLDIAGGYGAHSRIVEPAEFEEWFYRGADLDTPPELIPEHIRSMF